LSSFRLDLGDICRRHWTSAESGGGGSSRKRRLLLIAFLEHSGGSHGGVWVRSRRRQRLLSAEKNGQFRCATGIRERERGDDAKNCANA
jgi:hypothetical protein